MFRSSLRLAAAAFYRIGYKLHHKFFLQPQQPVHTPVIIIGSYLVGGAGKTPFTIWLAKHFQEQGKKVAVLCHTAAWDEFLMLQQEFQNSTEQGTPSHITHKIKLFKTGNRYRTAAEIQDKFDIILCDDGFEDSRFTGATRICLDWEEPPTSWTKLLPAGPFRSLKQDHDERGIIHLDCNPKKCEKNAEPPCIQFSVESLTNFTPGTALNATVICGIGSPKRFIDDILAFSRIAATSKIHIENSIIRRDHDKHFLQTVQNVLSQNKDIIITQKDACRLPQTLLTHPQLHIAIQKTNVSENAKRMIDARLHRHDVFP